MLRGSARRALVFGGIGLALTGVAFAAGASQSGSPVTRADLYRLQERIDERWGRGEFDRKGIFIQSTGHPVDRLCLRITLLNPTGPNIEYLQREFGPHVCISHKPADRLEGCPGYIGEVVGDGPIRVPDLRGLSVAAAEQAIVRAGLTYSVWCRGDGERRVEPPKRFSVEALTHVVAQCPRAGVTVPLATEVTFRATARLPGGFHFAHGTYSRSASYPDPPCQDARNLEN